MTTLDALTTARVIFALQEGRTSHADEEAIRDIFCATHGEELTRLKNQINMRTDSYDLEGLVYSNVDDDAIRQQILDHIAREAAGVHTGQAKVCIDVDDTLFSKLHDKLWPRDAIYPGALAFFDALDDGPDPEPFSHGDLAFVTGRPADLLGLMHDSTRRALTEAGISTSSIEQGPLHGLLSKGNMADGKVENLRRMRALFPEYALVFLGDSGQFDIRVAQDIKAEFGDHVVASFINDVAETPAHERAQLAAEGVYVNDTYVGAATKAFELGLISRAGLDAVADEAQRAFIQLEFKNDDDRARAQDLLLRDVAALPA